jgi:uncharacterized protein (DUF2141 family)
MKAALLVLVAVGAAAQDRNGSIIGIVSDAVSHQPLRRVMVTLGFPSSTEPPPSIEQQRANTDDAGAFAFHNLKPGEYRVAVERADYPAWKEVTVSPSEDPNPLHIELVPGAVVSGRILDEDGDPLTGCGVELHPAEHPELIVTRGDAEASEYRLFGFRPGKYILAVQCTVPAFQPRPFSAGPDPPPSLAYPPRFYPAAPDAASAEPVELAAGVEKTGVDFRMRPARVSQVRAVIAPSSADWHGRDLFGGLIRQGDSSGNQFGRMIPDSSGNAFLFQQVFPGSYQLLATTLDRENRMGAVQHVEVKDQPVSTVIDLKRAIDIHGTVEVESAPNSSKVSPSQIFIQLISDIPQFIAPEGTSVKQDGSFTISSVIPTEWHLYTHGASVFVKSIWLGGKELSGRTLDLSSGSADTLKIVLSANTASIRGTAPPGTHVACRSLDDQRLIGQSRTKESGQFRIEGLAPGTYRVAVVAEGESYDTIPENSWREITLQGGQTATVDLAAN